MLIGIGTDILRFDRLKEELLSEEDPFVKRIFTEKERDEAKGRRDRQQYFAGRFAAKEAVFKALRMKSDEVDLSQIEITDNENGAPEAVLYGSLKAIAAAGDIHVHLSISYETEEVIAFAAAERVVNEQKEKKEY